MNWLILFLENVRKRPGVFLGDEKVSTLSTYISGYTQARKDLGYPKYSDDEKDILEGFTYWLVLKLQKKLSLGWSGYIEHCFDSSEKNIYKFFLLFDEYINYMKDNSFEEIKKEYELFICDN